MTITKKVKLTIVLILLLFFASCTSENIYIDDVEDEAPLSIYLMEDTDLGLVDFVKGYNIFKPKENRKVEITKFKYDEKEGMYTQILNEMSLGGGPDIIVINQETDTYIDINKLSERNAFADMDILMEKSETFDFDDYNKMVLDAGILNNKRVFMPMTYKVEYLISSVENFKSHNLEITNELTMDAFINLLEEYYKNTPNNQATLWVDPVYLLEGFMELGKPIEKNDQLKRLFEILKTENERYVEPTKKDFYWMDDSFFNEYDPFFNNNYLFVEPKNYGYNQYRRLHENYNVLESIYESNMIWFGQPINENSTVKAYTETGLAININSKHKNEAFEFAQYILSYSVQSKTTKVTDLPVNNKTYNNEVIGFTEGYEGMLEYMFGLDEIEMPTKMKNDYISYIDSIENCEYIGTFRYIYLNIMQQSIEDYYNDKLTFDEMIDEINNKLAIYYSE